MINETINGQVQYEGDSSEIDLHAYDEAVKAKIKDLHIEVMQPGGGELLLDILNLSGEDDLEGPLEFYIMNAPTVVVVNWLCELETKFESYILTEYNYNHITNELWR